MSKLRTILLAIFALIALAFLGLSISTIRQGPGDGEVGTIIHGGLIVVGLGLALFFALAAAATAFWHRKPIRIAALIGLAIIVLSPVVTWGQHELKLYRWEAENKRKEDGATQLVALYDSRLSQAPHDRATLVQLRRDLNHDMLDRRFFWSSGGIKHWYWKHTLITKIFADPSYDVGEDFGVLDFPSTEACDTFLIEYPDALNSAARQAIFRGHCRNTPVD